MKLSARGSPETTICRYCGKTVTCQFINRMYCNYTCCRLFLYYTKSLIKRNAKITKYEATNKSFRKYLTDMIEKGEPLLQYKQWELYLRNNPMPKAIKSLIIKQEPLPRELKPIGIEAK